ncbi:hypothetical protein AZH11_06855 [Pseudomonas simiae]|nr:hypothetical protein AZH11_06855 [Pseudomonas simiae]
MFGVANYIVQTFPATLPAPNFANKPGAKLSIYPLDYESNAFISVAFPGMTTKHKITPEWIYPDGTLATIAAQNGVTAGRVDFPISEKIIAASVGKGITVRYVVTAGTKITPSDSQELTVQTIRTTDLPQAVINGVANKGTLDLAAFSGDGILALPKWRLSTVPSKVSINLRSEGVAPLSVRASYPITDSEAANGLMNVPVSRRWLEGVRKDGTIFIECRVTFDGSEDVSGAVEFPLTTYTVKLRVGVIATVAVGQEPHFVRITNDGLFSFVSNRRSNSISVIDIKARKVIDTLTGIQSPFAMTMSSDGSRLYVGSFDGKTVIVIDPASRKVVMRIPVPNITTIEGIALNGDDSRLFVSCHLKSAISVHDTKTGAFVKSIDAPGNPCGMALNPDKTQVYFTAIKQVAIVNANGLSGVVGSIPGVGRPVDIAFNPGNFPSPRAYVTDFDNVYIIDPVKNVIAKRMALRYPWGVVMNPRARECYVGAVSLVVRVSRPTAIHCSLSIP